MFNFILFTLISTVAAEFPPIGKFCNDSDPSLCPFVNSTACENHAIAAVCAKSCGCCEAKTCKIATCNGETQDSCCFDDDALLCPFINTTTFCENQTLAIKCPRTCGESRGGCCVTNECSSLNGRMECCPSGQSCFPPGSDSGGVPYDGGCCDSEYNWCDLGGCCDSAVDCCNPSGGGGGGGGGGMTCCPSDKSRCRRFGRSDQTCVECVGDSDCKDPDKSVCVFASDNDENYCAECYTDQNNNVYGCDLSTQKCNEQNHCVPK